MNKLVLTTKCLSVVMPAYNEEATLELIVDKVLNLEFLLELIIIDDCSTDKTSEIAQEIVAKNSKVIYVRQKHNRGKTEALKKGFSLAKGEIVIVQDADLEYDPEEIIDVIEPILNDHADVVYGSRFMTKKAMRVLYFYHYLANKGLTFLSNCLTNLNMTDVETCYKAFHREIIQNMQITSSGFGFEIEVTAKVAKLNCRIYEVPISYYGRTYEEGKKIGFKDGIDAFLYILKYNIFTNLKSSFHRIPELNTKRQENFLLTPNE